MCNKKKYKGLIFVLLVIYSFCILYLTVLSRDHTVKHIYEPRLFWSYVAWFKGNKGLGIQIIKNIIVYIPIGYLAYIVFNNKCLLYSISISLTSELSQLILRIGLFEYDDLFDNALGAIIGVLAFMFINKISNNNKRVHIINGFIFVLVGIITCLLYK